MPKNFMKPTDDDRALLGEALSQWHRDLLGAKVRIGLILVEPPRNDQGEATAPAITVAGNRVAAKIRCVPTKARLYNEHDAEIDIDADLWAQLNRKRRLALLDHELEHVVLLDGLEAGGRPKLTLQPDDYAISGFVGVAERHQDDSFEVIQLKAMWEQAGQMLFPWAEQAEKRPDSPGTPVGANPDREGGKGTGRDGPLPDGRGSEGRGSVTPDAPRGANKKGKAKVA